MSNFETAMEIVNETAIVKVRGYLSGHGGEQLEEIVDGLLGKGNRSIVDNFRETSLVNSVGISILITIIEKVQAAKGTLIFSELSQVNEEVFRLMGIHRHVSFKNPVDKAGKNQE